MAYTSILTLSGTPGSPGGLPANTTLTFPVEAVNFGIEFPTTIGSQSGGAGAGKAKFDDFSVTKKVDINSPILFLACASGSHFTTATLAVGAPGSATPTIVYTFKLVYVSKVGTSGSQHGGTTPEETVTLIYGAQSIAYQDSQSGQTSQTAWSVITNQSTLTIPGN